MASTHHKTIVLATGLAMFSMFFGAGNVVFPLAVGQYAQDKNFFAIIGLLITAVGVPFLGLAAMALFDGNAKDFFDRLGRIPGFIVAAVIMGLIGPFGAIPRCIALSYSTMKTYFPALSLPIFSVISCIVIFLFTYKRSRIIDILGYVLTPLLILSLAVIIIKGLISSPEVSTTDLSSWSTFSIGLKEGYQTMDLLGAFFFSSVVLECLRKEYPLTNERSSHKRLLILMLKASCIGAFLLAIIYVGFSYVAALHSENLVSIGKEELLSTLAKQILGPYAGIIACVTVALACLTTAIALTTVFAEFIHSDVTQNYVSYEVAIIITLIFTNVIATLNFTKIVALLAPILLICYPALITLSVLNLLYKLYAFKPVKIPVLAVFILSLIFYFM